MALTLFIILILATVTFTAVTVANLDSGTARQDFLAARALYAARAGLSRALAELTFNYNWAGGEGSLEEGAYYTVQVEPGPNNANQTSKIWKISSTGQVEGAQRAVEAWVELESFAKFAYFTDVEVMSTGTQIFFISKDVIKGPAHTNGFFSINGQPQFSDKTTSANQGDSLYNASTFTYNQQGTQTDPFRFYRLGSGQTYATSKPVAYQGSPSFSFAGGQSVIPLPTNTGAIQAKANKTYTGDYRFVFNEAGYVQVYRKSGASYAFVENVTTNGSPGLTLHVTGRLEMSGKVQGRVTVGATEDISITGDLVYADPSRDVLGVVGDNNVIVVSDPNRTQDRYIHASIMALNGSFTVNSYNTGRYRGTLHVLGGIIQKRRGPVGTFNSSGPVTGYTKDYDYDEKLLSTPPLNFPTTGKIVIRTVVDRGALGS
ncbi:MAG TPA: DUF4900 domain-containing protein [Candidatus Nitrosotenuis sp.]|nr:DUF4900 domain-containing protein [Candidatus Nitrosotenuis sp.]